MQTRKQYLSAIKLKSSATRLAFIIIATFALQGCLPEASGSKLKKLSGATIYKDNQKGCGESYFVFSTGNSCVASCEDYEGTHVGSSSEVETIKKDAKEEILTIITNSKGVCVDDVEVIKRPTNAFSINANTCTCRNGKSDVVNDCDSFCATKPNNANSIVYLDTTPGSEVLLNDKLKTLYNWCKVQLEDGLDAPECFLKLWDGSTEQYVPLTLSVNSNKATANISTITSINKAYVASIVESKSGATTSEFQIYRKQQTSSTPVLGNLKTTPISQYSCLTFGGTYADGVFNRNSEVRLFYYYPSNETPAPLPPYPTNVARNVICHDENTHPGNDSAEYPRFENIPIQFSIWDKTDPRFVSDSTQNGKLTIDKLIDERVAEESSGSTTGQGSLFFQISYFNRPTVQGTTQTAVPLGFMMVPFVESDGKAYCPNQTHFDGNQLIFNILKEFIPETEALYIAEKEAEIIQNGTTNQTIYGNMFIPESKILNVAFYIENGLKIKASAANMASKTIHFYWPIDEREDPLVQGSRKLYTIRSFDTLQGQIPTGVPTSIRPNDKRIGCVPKSN